MDEWLMEVSVDGETLWVEFRIVDGSVRLVEITDVDGELYASASDELIEVLEYAAVSLWLDTQATMPLSQTQH